MNKRLVVTGSEKQGMEEMDARDLDWGEMNIHGKEIGVTEEMEIFDILNLGVSELNRWEVEENG